MRTITRLPLFLILFAIFSASMILPAGYARLIGEYHDARSFLYGGLIGLILATMFGLALATREHNVSAQRQLVGFAASFLFLPLFLAVPFQEAVRNTSFDSAYFEMVSALTTTGATMYESSRLSLPEHLWRAQVGWMGGLMMWVAASGILAPLALGGFEVTSTGEPGQHHLLQGAARSGAHGPRFRLWRSTQELVPIYVGLTVVLIVLLLIAGEDPFVALCHAMAIMSTSGISPIGGLSETASGIGGEVILFCFLFFALSRQTFSSDTRQDKGIWNDPEFRLGALIVAVVPLALFLRHWVAAYEVGDEQNWLAGIKALWGSLFTALSFLSTTGFVSANWAEAQGWSGLETPGIILMGLALVGGGVATTAGGVKLMRVYALYLNGTRDIERLIHPSSVARSGLSAKRIRREGAFIAWVSFMLFALTIAAVATILGAYNLSFEEAITLTVATLSNTGPLVDMATTDISLPALEWDAKVILCLAMVLGRLELLAVIVMLSPDIWRN
jgi:trk system potassium uptake protein TrkH